MWPGELEELTVWADALQAEGHPLGQLVALGLRSEQLRGPTPEAAEQLAVSLEREIRAQAVALLGPLAQVAGVTFQWQLGVVRALTISSPPLPDAELFDALVELVQRPALRFLDHLHVAARPLANDDRFQLAVLELLTRPATLARPRRVLFGSIPERAAVIRPLVGEPARGQLTTTLMGPRFAELYVPLVTALSERGLTWLIRGGEHLSLPWAVGRPTTRVRALEQLLATPWTAQHTARLGRALWDTSIRVRRRVIEAIPSLPDEAAPLILPLLTIYLGSQPVFGDLVQRTLAEARRRPAWVRAVAQNHRACEPWVARWLSSWT